MSGTRKLTTAQGIIQYLPLDFVANARSLGAHAIKAASLSDFKSGLQEAKSLDSTTVIVVETDREIRVPEYDAWWDVVAPEVSESNSVQEARYVYEKASTRERYHL